MGEMMKPAILIIEDEAAIADAIRYALETEGYRPVVAGTGGSGLEHAEREMPELVILDIGLPDMSGFDVLRHLRSRGSCPVIFLTARGDETDRVAGLEMGADDYITKPFSPRELTARVRAVLRRSAEPGPLSGGVFRIDRDRRLICYLGNPLDLARCEYEILAALIRRPGFVFTREQLMQMAWENPDVSDRRTVDTHVKTIRRKLKAIRTDPDPIVTHRGFGYSLREDW